MDYISNSRSDFENEFPFLELLKKENLMAYISNSGSDFENEFPFLELLKRKF